MTIKDLLHAIQPGAEFTVFNEPFSFMGKAEIRLDGGETRFWLYERDGGLLAVSADEEEVICFTHVEEELEPQGDTILYGGKEYEFSYEDAGTVGEDAGDVPLNADDRLTFSDYESDDGEVLRMVSSENTGETLAYLGNIVVEDDILPIE